jgi:probable phosphoglycerate mutase
MFSHVYSSPLSRALETARTIEDKPTLVNDFGELRQGALEGLTAVEAIEGFPEFFEHWAVNPADAQVPGGETLGECSTRARHALTAICAKHSVGEAVLVVSHQMVMAALTCHATGRGLNSWRECCVDNVAATVLSWNGLSLGLEIAGWRPGDAPS